REIVLAKEPDAPFLFAAHRDFSPGIVGLAAARLTEEFYRPSAVAQIGDETTRGSARSVKEFHITEAFDQCKDLLVRHGGHAAAAGFTVQNEHLDALADALRAVAASAFGDGAPQPSLSIDAAVSLSALNERLMESLRQLEPAGYGNPTPLLAAFDVKLVSARRVGSDGTHLKMQVTDGRTVLDCIAFRQGDWFAKLPHRIDVAFTLEINEWNGERNVQLNVKDLRKAESVMRDA
ncbi:MAG: single-stranded-DNA-specific exonuclease RecJ, partial [Chloroflexi bacterium]|nr:single-stranded-DNA-specific exonuclease RecJ [Chloroflexota bacterium]